MSAFMERLESDMARIFRGPEFYPLTPQPPSPAPLAPLVSPERAPAVVSSEDAE